MKAVATKKGQSREKSVGFREMGSLRCDGCGEEFLISHDPALADKRVAEKQAGWLERSWPKSTSATRNTRTAPNCRSDHQDFD